MAPRFPKSGKQADLEELVPYTVSIRSFEIQETSEKYGASLKVVYELIDDHESTVWDFINYLDAAGNAKLGKSPSGQVSRFRAFCNAVGGRPEAEKVGYFDDEEMLIVWANGGELRLEPGLRLRIIGEHRERRDDDGTVFRVVRYRPVVEPETPRRSTARKREQPPDPLVSSGVDPDEVPFG